MPALNVDLDAINRMAELLDQALAAVIKS